MDYVEVEEARTRPGVKLVLSRGVPGPWGEAAKAVLAARGIAFVPVAQTAMGANDAQVAWIGVRNAPVLVHEGAPPLTNWLDILMFAERMGQGRSLVPDAAAARTDCLGVSALIGGAGGLGWLRRLTVMTNAAAGRGQPIDPTSPIAQAYGYSPAEAAAAPARLAAGLRALADRLHAQAARGSVYLIGDALSAADLYWACFSQMVAPLPFAVNPMPAPIRTLYETMEPVVTAALDPILFVHRDRIVDRHIGLPLDY